jgi:hypothetical protein
MSAKHITQTKSEVEVSPDSTSRESSNKKLPARAAKTTRLPQSNNHWAHMPIAFTESMTGCSSRDGSTAELVTKLELLARTEDRILCVRVSELSDLQRNSAGHLIHFSNVESVQSSGLNQDFGRKCTALISNQKACCVPSASKKPICRISSANRGPASWTGVPRHTGMNFSNNNSVVCHFPLVANSAR